MKLGTFLDTAEEQKAKRVKLFSSFRYAKPFNTDNV